MPNAESRKIRARQTLQFKCLELSGGTETAVVLIPAMLLYRDSESRHRLAPQVGLEPTTLRLTAVRVVLTSAATGCYKLLSFLQFTSSLLGTV